MTDAPAVRYALYYAPEVGSPWWQFGAHWLGRDDVRDVPLSLPDMPALLRSERTQITEPARRYGFHATLRAPFHLAAGVDEAVLTATVERLAARLRPVRLGALVPSRLSGFVALTPSADPPGLRALAGQCVLALEPMRAPLSETERARRRTQPLDRRGLDLLERYGYPYVMDRFRFHMTLSAPLDDDTAGRVLQVVQAMTQTLNHEHPPVLDRLCLFVEPVRGAPFLRRADFRLDGGRG